MNPIEHSAHLGADFAARLPLVDGRVDLPLLSTIEVSARLGEAQRRAFEWSLLAHAARRNGESATAQYCDEHLAVLLHHGAL
jgi:hypothetical protein